MSAFEVNRDPTIMAIFNEAQQDNSPNHLVSKLIRIFNEDDTRRLTSAFLTCMKVPLASTGDVNLSVDRVFEFASQFIISVAGLDVPDNSHIKEDAIEFLYYVFQFFETFHTIPNPNVRKRICQFISKLLLRMSPEAMLDCRICDTIVNITKERIKDKLPVIRIQAILAVFRLQEKENKNCPVTRMLVNCIETDTCAEVRRTALSKVSLSQRSHISITLDRINDISEKVRKETYIVLSKLHIKLFTIEQRKQLLNTGIYDNNELVKNTVKTVLLPAWLKRMENNFLALLKALDLNLSSMEVSTIALMSLFGTTSHEHIVEVLDTCLDKEIRLISYEELTAESAFLWRCYVFYLSDMVSESNNYCWESGKSYDASAEGLLPDLSVFCEYIKKYYEFSRSKDEHCESPWKKKEYEFILIQLIELCKVYDYADEVGRKELKMVCLELLKEVEMETIKPIVELYFMLQTNLSESISKITELINDLLYPNNPSSGAAVTEAQDSYASGVNSVEMDDSQRQNIKFKIAQLEVKLVELKDSQEEAIELEDFSKAQELKGDIVGVQEKIQELKGSLVDVRSAAVDPDLLLDDDTSQHSEDEQDEVCQLLENMKPEVVRRCLVILQEMLHLKFVKQLSPELRTLFQLLVLPACKSDNYNIAPLATEVLGSFCLRDEALAKEYFTTFFAFCGNNDLCVNALKVIFDFLLCFGPSTFKIDDLNDYEKKETNKRSTNSMTSGSDLRDSDAMRSSTDSDDDEINIIGEKENAGKGEQNPGLISGYTFISVLVDLLDDEFVEARFTVVHGLCQLMATGKLKSSKVLTRLILIWFHPASKDSVEIRDCLNFFFPFFVKHCSWALQLFENAIIPTMDVLFNAPVHNPLSGVDQKCVLKVICDLTSPNFIEESSDSENTHFNIGVLMCNHLMDLKDQNHQVVLLKGLEYLDLSTVDASMLPTLINLVSQIVKKFQKKNYKKSISEAKKIETKYKSLMKNRKTVSQVINESDEN